jgi:hypothetical protein
MTSLLGHKPLQVGIPAVQLLQPVRVRYVHAAVLVALAEERLLGYVLLAAELPGMPAAWASRSIRTLCSSVNRFFICQRPMVKLSLGLPVRLATTCRFRAGRPALTIRLGVRRPSPPQVWQTNRVVGATVVPTCGRDHPVLHPPTGSRAAFRASTRPRARPSKDAASCTPPSRIAV